VTPDLRPLDPVRSIKTKLGALVAVTVAVASLLATLATRAGASPWLVVPAAVIAGLVVTQALARGMTSPLRDMTAAAGKMAAGDYSHRVHTRSRDEVGELAEAFNRMAATLEAVDQQRRDLVANVSHELRTPITALQAMLENLADGVISPDPEALRTALTQTERLGRLVSVLLDLSRVEEGIAPFTIDEVGVLDLLDDAVAQAEVSGLEYVVDADQGLVVPGDPERLHQLLANLLDNAARHSPAGGRITVSARHEGGSVTITVADQGPGIPEADRDRVFERFVTSSAHTSGTGLGLAIARWVAQLHRGSIAVVDADGTGATIAVSLPFDADQVPPKKETVMSTPWTPPAPPVGPPTSPGAELGRWWPDVEGGRPGVVGVAAGVGLFAALILPSYELGLGWALTWAAVCTVVALAGGVRGRDRLGWADLGLALCLIAMLAIRDAEWVTMLCLFGALGVTAVSSTRARTVIGTLLTFAAVPLAGLRGLPWLGRSVMVARGSTRWLPWVRTVVLSVVLLLVFGALFVAADAVFADWVDSLTPDVSLPELPGRLVLGTFIAGGTLAAAYVALSRPRVDEIRPTAGPDRGRFEWLVPLLVVDAVFALFLIAQATVMFGGHDYLRRTTGLTYAEYVHQGFGELTVATALTLTVLGWVAGRSRPGRDRTLAAGALGIMTLIVVASALYRMAVYMDAYGFTRLRLLVSVFEGWLGVVLIVVLIAGVVGSRHVVPVAVRLGAAALLALALANPDAWIAEHNLSRDTTVTPIDYRYLGELSSDAYPVIADLPAAEFACITSASGMAVEHDDWLGWNLGRSRAADLQRERPPAADGIACHADR